ncbi:beta-mannosyltransferase 1-like [Andrographis paniculata]|uniref:beta-mannosyltransferase 1-like n=1 Tax=Andrographis paniculata TaxID=175694 RepID=UPI0021E74FB6|nr:beta-mannosyltransferase 1-like [Andrographis paniculata]
MDGMKAMAAKRKSKRKKKMEMLDPVERKKRRVKELVAKSEKICSELMKKKQKQKEEQGRLDKQSDTKKKKKRKRKNTKEQNRRRNEAKKEKWILKRESAKSGAICWKLAKKKRQVREALERLDREGAAIAEAVALRVLLDEDSEDVINCRGEGATSMDHVGSSAGRG